MAGQIDKLERLTALHKVATQDYVSYEQLEVLLRRLTDTLKTAKEGFAAKLDQKTLEYLRRYNAITDLVDETATQLDAAITQKADARQTRDQIEQVRRELKKLAIDLRDEIPEVPDLAPLELELARIKNLIPPKVDDKAIWASLNELTAELEDARKEMVKLRDVRAPGVRILGGARGFQLLVGGAKKGQVNYVNFVAGNGVTITHNTAHGRNDITFNATGGGEGGSLAVLTATGTVDDSNTTFTFVSTPVVVVVNGASYRDGHGATITGTSVELDYPVGTGGDIYALG